MFATGSNLEATRLSGINVQRTKHIAYMITGVISACAGIMLTARMSSAQPQGGVGYDLEGIAAAVIGGVSMAGGRGNIGNTIIGALIMGVLRNGLNLNGMDSFTQQVVIGLVIIIAVLIDKIRSNRISGG